MRTISMAIMEAEARTECPGDQEDQEAMEAMAEMEVTQGMLKYALTPCNPNLTRTLTRTLPLLSYPFVTPSFFSSNPLLPLFSFICLALHKRSSSSSDSSTKKYPW